jgi:maltooligosyltrehalose trehalohydrolase
MRFTRSTIFPRNIFLEQLKLEVEQLSAQTGRHLFLIPESDLNDPRLLWPRERGGFNLDAQWSDDFHHALHTVLTGEKNGYYSDFGTLEHLAKSLQNAFVYDGTFSQHRRRKHGASPNGLSGQIGFSATCKITTRSAIARRANAAAR